MASSERPDGIADDARDGHERQARREADRHRRQAERLVDGEHREAWRKSTATSAKRSA